jgi:hypothetical protein
MNEAKRETGAHVFDCPACVSRRLIVSVGQGKIAAGYICEVCKGTGQIDPVADPWWWMNEEGETHPGLNSPPLGLEST